MADGVHFQGRWGRGGSGCSKEAAKLLQHIAVRSCAEILAKEVQDQEVTNLLGIQKKYLNTISKGYF